MSGQFHLQIGEIGIESLTKTDGSTILRDKHTAGSGQGGCNLNLLRCKINLSLGLSLPGLYKTGRCFSRSPQLQRKTRHSSHSGLPRSLEPPHSPHPRKNREHSDHRHFSRPASKAYSPATSGYFRTPGPPTAAPKT